MESTYLSDDQKERNLLIDIHCHILYGLDDGAESLAESIEMAKQAEADGVHKVLATPHFTKNYRTQYEQIMNRITELQTELDRQAINVKIYPGNEVRLESFDFLMEHITEESFHYLGGNEQFVLLEQRWGGYDPKIMKAIRYFIGQNVTPIIAHPERHPYIREEPERLLEMIANGAWTQISVDSMTGQNGEEAKDFSMALLNEDLIHTIASDAHNTIRKINLSLGYDIIRNRVGEKKVSEIQQRIETILPSS